MLTYLLCQCIYFDRPRLMHQLLPSISSPKDIHSIISKLPINDPFKKEALNRIHRFKQLDHQLKQHHIQWVTIKDSQYPPSLHQLSDPPLVIFFKGTLKYCHQNCIGIVGTRRPSIMAPYRMETLYSTLDHSTIVSGGAIGIDHLAHKYALQHHIPTTAILASGLDVMVPHSNQPLFKQIIASGIGSVFTECPPGTIPKPYYFPQRNRLIAALSKKLIIVEAGKRSGAVLTANIAAQLGIDVGAMVGAFNAKQSEGCYDLMNDGATVLGSTTSITEFLELKPNQQSLTTFKANHSLLLDIIPTEPIHIEDLVSQCDLTIDQIIEEITTLSLNGDVIITSGQMISRHE